MDLLTWQQLTTVSSYHMQNRWRILHLYTGQCPGAQSVWNNFLACNSAKCSQILKILSPANSTDICSKWLLSNSPHLKHVATLPCDLSSITMDASDFRLFSDIDVSQGSVAACLRCGGIVNDNFVANLPVILPVKEFWKSVNIWRSYGWDYSGLFFDSHCRTKMIFISKSHYVEQN